MADITSIQWCRHTASPWYGCAHKIMEDGTEHPGCGNCYAEAQSVRNPDTLGIWGQDGTRVKSKSFIANLRKWNRAAEKAGEVASVFPSICDPFEDRPELVPWREEMFAVADDCPWIRLLLLTKRPENIRRMWPEKGPAYRERITTNRMATGIPELADAPFSAYRDNVWLLTSVSDQQTADAALDELEKCADLAPVLGCSYEPALGPVDFSRWFDVRRVPTVAAPYLGATERVVSSWLRWIIVGGESGPHARPFDVAWARSTVEQCRAAGVPVFIKQDSGPKSSMQGRFTDEEWAIKEFPNAVQRP